MTILIFAAAFAVVVATVAVNIWNNRRRAQLSKADRAAEDQEIDRDMRAW